MAVNTRLVKDGNSVAVRLPKALLALSGLKGPVQLEAKKGQIIIKQQKKHPRDGWEEQIAKLVAEHGDPGDEFKDWREADFGEWDNLAPWNGPTYEEWLKQHDKN